MDGPHVQGVAQDELDSFPGTKVGEPVPGEGTLHADNQILSEGSDGSQEGIRRGGQVLVVDDLPRLRENADIHPAGMQIYPAVVLTRLNVESHWRPPGLRGFDTLEPTP